MGLVEGVIIPANGVRSLADASMKIKFSKHALEQMQERGASPLEVEEAIRAGEEVPAKKNRRAFRLNFQYNDFWGGRIYRVKQVVPIVVDEGNGVVVITFYVYYF